MTIEVPSSRSAGCFGVIALQLGHHQDSPSRGNASHHQSKPRQWQTHVLSGSCRHCHQHPGWAAPWNGHRHSCKDEHDGDDDDDDANIHLKGAVVHVLGNFVQPIGVAAAGALIWWKQVVHPDIIPPEISICGSKQG